MDLACVVVMSPDGIRGSQQQNAQHQHGDRCPRGDPETARPSPTGRNHQPPTSSEQEVNHHPPPPPKAHKAVFDLPYRLGSALAGRMAFVDNEGRVHNVLVFQPKGDQDNGETDQEAAREHKSDLKFELGFWGWEVARIELCQRRRGFLKSAVLSATRVLRYQQSAGIMMPNVRVARLPGELTWARRGTAVVIDVLRATTVITGALDSGAIEVLVCGEIADAFRLAQQLDPRPMLCGERNCLPVPGFDLGNSPVEYRPETVAGKRLVMTTTNGTRAVLAAEGFPQIIAAAFNNLAAVIDYLGSQTEVSIVCAGTDGVLTLEDMLLAGAIVAGLLNSAGSPDPPEAGTAERQTLDLWSEYLSAGRSLSEVLGETLGGRNLKAAGYDNDIRACAAFNTTTTIGLITPSSPKRFRRMPCVP